MFRTGLLYNTNINGGGIVHNKDMGLTSKFGLKRMNLFHKKYKIGLCLSGGGTRGFAHLGAFKAFEEYGIKFDAVAGASAGSLFGALYASGLKSDQIYEMSKQVKQSDFIKQKFGILPSSMDTLAETLDKVLPIKRVENLKIPFYAVAVDLKTGKQVVFKTGKLNSVITGSCAIPGVFLPVKYRDMMLIDGGVRNNVPADVLFKNGCDFVITIDCNSTRGGGTDSNRLWTQFVTSIGIMMVNNSKQGLMWSDLVIAPDMAKFNSLKLKNKDEMIKAGYDAVVKAIPEIEKIFLGKHKRKWIDKRKQQIW